MKKHVFLIVALLLTNILIAQKTQYYKNNKGQTHFCGEVSLHELQTDSISKKWFSKYYDNYTISDKKHKWAKKLKDVEVEIFLGTWCGTSKKYVSQFVKMWQELGLDKSKLKFITVYSGGMNKYKQSPNREEKGKEIYRVPTFIFNKKGKEITRIVETPINDLETDVKQIALDCPSIPKYRGAYALAKILREKTLKELKESYEYINVVYRKTKSVGELNSLGYVYLDIGENDKALLSFYYNTLCFPYKPNVYDSYAEALEKVGKYEEAKTNYQKVLLLDKKNKNALKKLKELRKKLKNK